MIYLKNILLAFILLLTISCTSCALSRSIKDLYQESSSAVLYLENGDSSCSSFHIGNGIIITAAHCVGAQVPWEEAGELSIHIDSVLVVHNPKVLLDDNEHDIAILNVPEARKLPFLVLGNIPQTGERLTTIGYPGWWDGKKTFDIGYVLGNDFLEGTLVIFGSGNAFPGESGGPVLDERGFVVGIASRISPRGIMWPGGRHLHRDVSIFVSSEELKGKLHDLKIFLP